MLSFKFLLTCYLYNQCNSVLVSQEEELRSSGDAKYTHLSEDLHVLIEVEAPPGQAHARLGIAIEEIKKFLKPVSDSKRLFKM